MILCIFLPWTDPEVLHLSSNPHEATEAGQLPGRWPRLPYPWEGRFSEASEEPRLGLNRVMGVKKNQSCYFRCSLIVVKHIYHVEKLCHDPVCEQHCFDTLFSLRACVLLRALFIQHVYSRLNMSERLYRTINMSNSKMFRGEAISNR